MPIVLDIDISKKHSTPNVYEKLTETIKQLADNIGICESYFGYNDRSREDKYSFHVYCRDFIIKKEHLQGLVF